MADKNSKMPGFMKAMFAKKAGKGGKKGKPFADGGQMERDHQKTGKKIAQVNEKMRKKDTAAAGYAKGGMMADKMGRAMKKKSADTMGRAMKKYAKGGSIDGCATKGKTKGTMIQMAKGGGAC